MPISDEDEREERQLRVDQMTVNIEKMRRDMRLETWKVTVSAVIALAAAVGAGVAIGNYFTRPQQPQTILIQIPPPPTPSTK